MTTRGWGGWWLRAGVVRAVLWCALVAGVIASGGVGGAALAQDAGDGADGADGSGVQDGAGRTGDRTQQAPGRAVAGGTNEVRIEIESVGVRNVARAGEWVGIRLRLTDSGSEQRNVLVRLNGLDSDGDSPQQQREVTLNPGVAQGVWMYMRLPFDETWRTPLTVSVHEAVEAPGVTDDTPRELQFRAGTLLARMQVQSRGTLEASTVGLIGVMGDRALGLRQYSQRVPGTIEPFSLTGHELTQVVQGITPQDIPDRWMGLQMFDVILWGSGEISELRGERARALSEWVLRGGHLVVVLPPVGQAWTSRESNAIYDIMPNVIVGRQENVELRPYRPMLMTGSDPRFPARGVVHTFAPAAGATQSEATPILNGPGGETVVVRRLAGAGAVTMIGLDLNQRAIAEGELVDAEVFWHRVLGRRGSLTPQPTPANAPRTIASRQAWLVDDGLDDAIAITGRSAVGALVAFTLFGIYWLVVGPVGFYLLRRKDQHRLSWLLFLGGAGVFTLLAWGMATALRPSTIQATHVTLLDHVYGQPVQRARMWASVLVPRYGEARISAGSQSGDEDQSLAALTAWEGVKGGATTASFPDVRGYAVDTRTPDAATVPVRATVKQVQADWAGAPSWDMIRPVNPQDGSVGTLRLDQNWTQSSQGPLVTGWLTHNMPGALRDGVVIVVRRQVRVSGGTGALLPVVAQAYALPGVWEPGAPISLDAITRLAGGGERASLQAMLDNLNPSGDRASGIEGRLMSLALLPLLSPPEEPTGNLGLLQAMQLAQRRATHGWDISRWFTQPCVIVVGFVGGVGGSVSGESDSPVPLFVDGRSVPTRGRTMVRWMYPLTPNPPEVAPPDDRPRRTLQNAAGETRP